MMMNLVILFLLPILVAIGFYKFSTNFYNSLTNL